MPCCPFHDDKNPRMKLDERYYCFGCQATGDAIDFVSQLQGISKKKAAEELAELIDTTVEVPEEARNFQQETKDQRNLERYYLNLLTLYEKIMRKRKEMYAPISPKYPYHPLFLHANLELCGTELMVDLLLSADPEARKDALKLIEQVDMVDVEKIVEEGKARGLV